jgi:CheY-specific phosphatase CheX
MNQSDCHQINGMLVECATALLEAFGTTSRYDPTGESKHPAQEGMLAIIGFGGTGEALRGSLVVGANRGLLRRSCPVADEGSDDRLQDWLGELANQLLGRLKSRLLAHGIVIQLGTPTTVSGLELRVRCSGDRQATPLWLLAGNDWFVMRLDAIAAPGVELCVSPDPSSAATEGEVLLF